MAEDTNNTGQAFSTGNFSNVDDIMSIIDSKKEESVNNDPDEVRNIDMQDNGIEYGVGKRENRFSSNNEDVDSEKTEDKDVAESEGTQIEQSASSDKADPDQHDAEDNIEAQESQSEDPKESREIADDSDSEEVDYEDVVVQMEDGSEIKIDQIVEDWKNNQDWQRANTEKAQELAEQKREFELNSKSINNEAIQTALENDDLLEALDDWFEGDENNPFRNAIFEDKKDLEAQSSQENNPLETERVKLNIDKEIFELQKMDESLNDEGNLNSLVDYAMENELRLETAYKLSKYDSLTNDFDSVRDELKQRNEELSTLKKQAQKSIPQELPQGKGAMKEEHSGSAGTWGGAENRVLKKLGLG